MYKDSGYAASRLNGTIVRLMSGTPVVIEDINDYRKKIRCSYHELSNKEQGQCFLEDLNLVPVPLGFCNGGKGLSYLARRPMRNDWRQGLRTSNFISMYGQDHRYSSDQELHNTIVGNYPTLEEVLSLNKSKATMAFSRSFAVDKNGNNFNLLYKWYGSVGDIVNKKVSLHKQWSHLQNLVEEVVV